MPAKLLAKSIKLQKYSLVTAWGGAAILKAATQLPEIKAVVTIGAPSDVGHVSHLFENDIEKINSEGQAEVSLASRPFLIKKQFIDDIKGVAVIDCVKKLKPSLLVLHSPIDNTVSIDHACQYFYGRQTSKKFC